MDALHAAYVLAHPVDVLLAGAGVDDEQVVVVGELVDDDVVDEGAVGVEQRRVVGLALLELRGVVHGDVLDGGERVGAAELDVAHVGDVEDADAGAHGHVLGDEAGVFDGHVPAAEVDHLGAEAAVGGVQVRSCGVRRSGRGAVVDTVQESFGKGWRTH